MSSDLIQMHVRQAEKWHDRAKLLATEKNDMAADVEMARKMVDAILEPENQPAQWNVGDVKKVLDGITQRHPWEDRELPIASV